MGVLTEPETRRVAVVTGAASGIGEAAAQELSARGWALGLLDVDPDGERVARRLSTAGCPALFREVDVSSEVAVRASVAQVTEALGPVQALVNSAGTIAGSSDVVNQTWEQWTRIMHVNAGGAFLCTRAVLPGMLAAGRGVIVNLSSISGLVGLPGQSAYAMSKGAIIQLTRQVTADYAREGIRCCAICPGSITTPLLTRAIEQDPSLPDMLRAAHPAGRLGEPREIGELIAFLVSEQAGFTHGAVISADGGYVAV